MLGRQAVGVSLASHLLLTVPLVLSASVANQAAEVSLAAVVILEMHNMVQVEDLSFWVGTVVPGMMLQPWLSY